MDYRHDWIKSIILMMRAYQRKNSTTEMCMTNTQYLYDCVKASFPDMDVKAKAVICGVNNYKGVDQAFIIHLMIIVDGVYYEPSHELHELKPIYFSSIKNLLDGVVPNTIIKDNLSDLLPKFLHFVKLEEDINAGGLLITDKEYYNEQADFVNFCTLTFQQLIK
jgi:hypothetical protein